MKKTIASILFLLTASQANADGFYQQIIGVSAQTGSKINQEATEFTYTPFTYTPLYLQVVGNPQENPDHSERKTRFASETTFTPLYNKVMGQSG